jgi:hypothetical protein
MTLLINTEKADKIANKKSWTTKKEMARAAATGLGT